MGNGYNHRWDCACDFCTSAGAGLSRQTHAVSIREATALLKSYSIRSITDCYINSNAHCPVCRQRVFFYSNEHGSRVYFDDLAPTWNKHPCTDNSASGSGGGWRAPRPKERAVTRRLLQAAQQAGRAFDSEWIMLEIVFVQKSGKEIRILARGTTAVQERECKFTASQDYGFRLGDCIFIKGDEAWYLDRKTLVPIKFKAPRSVESW